MKRFILSISTIIIFGIYVVYAKSIDISTLNLNNQEIDTLDNKVSIGIPASIKEPQIDSGVVVQSPAIVPKKVNKTICGWKSVGGSDDEEDVPRSRYVCTTTLVYATPVKKTTTVAILKPAVTTTTSTPAPKLIVATPPPVIKPKPTSGWNDGVYTGDSVDAYYGNVQVRATISGGRLTDVIFLDYPQDRSTSLRKSQNAMPILKSEAISSQKSNVNSVSGATYTSEAFNQSLAYALSQAKV